MRWGVLPGLLLLLASALSGCAATGRAAGPYPGLAEYAGREVRQVEFAGNLQIPGDSLELITVTRPTRCGLPFLPLGLCPLGRDRYFLDLQELARDVARIQLYYRDHGFFGTRIIPSVDPLQPGRVAVRFAVIPGDRVTLTELLVEGTEEIVPPEELLRTLPLREGEPFRRAAFLSSADTVRAALLQRGYAYAEVQRNYAIDTIADVAEVQFVAIPGPLVRVDSIDFVGTDRLSERTARRALTFREEDILRVAELNRSQRNLYALGLVNFASVEIGAGPVDLAADTARAGVLVRIVEAPQYLVDASAGYGTVDCFRTEARWTNRNFIGGARRLEVSGLLSKIGVGAPLDAGLENSLCPALENDRFSDEVNYRIAADLQQPQLFGTRSQLGANIRAERLSELNAFLRQAWGGQIALSRNLGWNAFLTTTVDVEHGFTRADPAVFCIGFDVCTPEDWAPLEQSRWSNALSQAVVYDRTQTEGIVTRGYQLRGGAAWSSGWLGSDDRYLRLIGDAVGYHWLRPGWVLAARLQGGIIPERSLDPVTNFIPPERRFYAGGPNSVRGFARNALGSVVYVADLNGWDRDEQGNVVLLEAPRSSPTGGTQLAVGSLELRMPSPVLPQFTRIGAFVDAGQVWSPGTDLATAPLRVTPGMGLRFITPVGPIRIDAAYNAYGRQLGPLFLPDFTLEERNGQLVRVPTGQLIRAPGLGTYQPPVTLRDRFQFHFAVGQAF
ncbi:MAG TPA: BamA/TamA family outer membrane protein [Longimicrobiaceae bacterium]|nr:BamA/TamA family outer membrane protein [Longimicrobiaceae bacterium]